MAETQMTETMLNGNLEQPPVEEKAETKEEKPLYSGFTGDLKTTEELASYTKGLEEQLVQIQIAKKAAVQTIPNQTVVVKAPEDDIEALWYSNPTKAAQLIEERVEAKQKKKEDARQQEETFWKNFYEKNTDLSGNKKVVELILKDEWSKIEKLPVDEASKQLAKSSRDFLSSIKKGFGTSETALESKGAAMTGASGEPMVRSKETPPQPKNFAEQVAMFRRRGSKAS